MYKCHFCNKSEKQKLKEIYPEIDTLRINKKFLYNKATSLRDYILSNQVGNLNDKRNDYLRKEIEEYEELVSQIANIKRKIQELENKNKYLMVNLYEFGEISKLEKFVNNKYFDGELKFVQHEGCIYVCRDCYKYINEFLIIKRKNEIGNVKILSEEERGISKKLSGKELEEELKILRQKFKGKWMPNPLEE